MQMMLMQQLQQFAAEAAGELDPQEQQIKQQIFFNLQMQHSQQKLQGKILEATKQLTLDALPPEEQAAGMELQARMAAVEKECKELEMANKAQEAAEKGTQFFSKQPRQTMRRQSEAAQVF